MLWTRRHFIVGAAVCISGVVRADNWHTPQGVCKSEEPRLSYKGHRHCDLHPHYAVVFPRWGCNCSTGECRPTAFKRVPMSEQVPEGVLVMVAGEYYPVPKGRLRQERKIPEPLLQWEAHVCCTSEPTPASAPNITCAWINILA